MVLVWVVSLAFLVVNIATLWIVLHLNRQNSRRSFAAGGPVPESAESRFLEASAILDWEFEYARTTASESMEQRHTMINFYLLVAGVVTSGVVALLAGNVSLPRVAGTVLLWLLCGIGWLYFLSVIRLRQAWHDSARTMNEIKDFYIRHVKDVEPGVLLNLEAVRTSSLLAMGLLVVLAVAFFAFHIRLYFAFLAPDPRATARTPIP